MGYHDKIDQKNFPKQGDMVGKTVDVMFKYKRPTIKATCVRDDTEDPYIVIFKLEDGRYVLGTECQYVP